MSGQPSIYKMPKEIVIGAKPLLQRIQYAWWPPKQFKNISIGQFDIYPETWNELALKKLVSTSADQAELGIETPSIADEERKIEVTETNCSSVFHVSNLISLKY